jgi:RecJ-like exonuclease
MTIRATDSANFSVHELINHLNKKLPNAFVNGGGHKNAGSINFLPYMKEKVLNELKEFIFNR